MRGVPDIYADGTEGWPPAGEYILAATCAQPDRHFTSLADLAKAIADERAKVPGRPYLAAVAAQVARSDLPGGYAISLRLQDGSAKGRGSLLGFAFVPKVDRERRRAQADALMDLIIAASPDLRDADAALAASIGAVAA